MEAALYFPKPKYPFVASPYARRRQLLSEVAADCFILPNCLLRVSTQQSNVCHWILDLGYWRRTNPGSVILSLSTQNKVEFVESSLSDGQESLSFRPLLAIAIPSMPFLMMRLTLLGSLAVFCHFESETNAVKCLCGS